MTFQFSVRISYDILEYKTRADIKEEIILDIFPVINFTTCYDPSPPLWDVVDNIMLSL